MPEENIIEKTEETNETVNKETNENENLNQKSSFEIGSFNKMFETSFENEGSLKQALNNLKDYDNLKSQFDSAQDQAKKYYELLDYYKPEKLYGDEETHAFIELRKKFPDKDLGVISKIRSQEFNSMSDLDKLLLADKLKVISNVSDSTRKRGIMQKLGIEADDLSEFTETDHYKIATALSDNISVLNDIRNFKPESKEFDLAQEKENYEKNKVEARNVLSNKVAPFVKSLLKNYDGPKALIKDSKGENEEIFNYKVDDLAKNNIIDSVVQVMVDNNMEPNTENLQKAQAYIDNHFKVINFDKIVSAAIKHGQSLAKEIAHNEIHTDKPVNTQEAQKTSSNQGLTLKERMRKNWDKK